MIDNLATIEYGGVQNEMDNGLILFRPTLDEIREINADALLSLNDNENIKRFNDSKEGALLFGRRHPDVMQLKNILNIISNLKGVDTLAIEGPPQLQPVINAVLEGDVNQEAFLRKVVNYFAVNHMAARSSEVPYIFSYLDIAKTINAKRVLLVDTDFSWSPEPSFMGETYHYKLPAQSDTSGQRETKMISLLQDPINNIGLKNLDLTKLFYDGETNNVPEVMVGDRTLDFEKKLATGKTVLLSGKAHTGRLAQKLSGLGVENASIFLPTNILNKR